MLFVFQFNHFQELGQMVIEVAFPSCAENKLTEEQIKNNKLCFEMLRRVATGKKLNYNGRKWVFESGSRGEGLAMRVGWGHEEPDLDVMLLWERLWGVSLKARASSVITGAVIVLETQGCRPGFCRLRVHGDHKEMARYMASFTGLHGPDIYDVRASCIVEKDGKHWMSPRQVVKVLIDDPSLYQAEASASPAVSMNGGTMDVVATLICVYPLPFVRTYLSRPRSRHWPTKTILDDITKFPTLIVAAGHKQSTERDIEWRISSSHMEFVIMNGLPLWVKQAYWPFKYIMKKAVMAEDTSETTGQRGGRSKVCSFHFKMTLLWELEKTESWLYESSFRLMIRLFLAFVKYLEDGQLPHYFMPGCNLLDCVTRSDLDTAAHYIKDAVLVDPIGAIISSPIYPNQLYSSPNPGGESVKEEVIVAGFRQLFQMVIGRPLSYPQSINYINKMLYHLDTYRGQRLANSSRRKKDRQVSNQQTNLVDMFSQICQIWDQYPPCSYCGLFNHTEEQCRHREHIICTHCRQKGHKAPFCPYDPDAMLRCFLS